MPTTFHRRASPTQTMREGRANQGSDIPAVDGYIGPLPPGVRGTEYVTHVDPDPEAPPRMARWTAHNPGVIVEGEFARIPVTVTRSTQLP